MAKIVGKVLDLNVVIMGDEIRGSVAFVPTLRGCRT